MICIRICRVRSSPALGVDDLELFLVQYELLHVGQRDVAARLRIVQATVWVLLIRRAAAIWCVSSFVRQRLLLARRAQPCCYAGAANCSQFKGFRVGFPSAVIGYRGRPDSFDGPAGCPSASTHVAGAVAAEVGAGGEAGILTASQVTIAPISSGVPRRFTGMVLD